MKYTGQLWHFFSVFLTFAFDYDSVSGCRRDNESVAERKPFIWCKYASYFSSTYSILLPCPHSNGRKVQKVKIIYCFLDIWLKVEKYLIDKSARNVACMRRSPHLVFGHSTNNQWAHHPRQSANTVRDAHQDASIARRNVQVIDIKPWWRKNSTKEKKKIYLLFVGQTLWTWCFTIWLKLRKGRQQFLGTKDVDLKIKKRNTAAVFSHLSLTALGKGSNLFCRQCEARPHVHPLPHPDWLNDWVSSWADCSRGAASTELLNIAEESLEATACAAAADLCLVFSKHKQYRCLPSERASEWMNADERLVLPDYCK